MRESHGFSVADAITVLLAIALVAVAVALIVLPDPAQRDYPTPEQLKEMMDKADSEADTPLIQADEYFHQPILITDNTQTGPGASAWDGLCTYLGTTEQGDALYTAADDADAIQAAIEQAEIEMVPSVIILHGSEAAKTVKEVQSLYEGTYFLLLDATVSDPTENVCCLSFATEQAGFLAGFAAAMEGYTRLAFISERDDEQSRLYEAGFYQGADMAAQQADRKVHVVSQQGCETLPDAEVAFVCGSYAFETATAQKALDVEMPLIGTQNGIKTNNPTLASQSFLTFVTKNYSALVETGLEAIDSGAWEQFYGAQKLRFDLQWGETVGMDEEHWTFTHYIMTQYQQILANLANDPAYRVEKTISDEVRQRLSAED